MVNEIWLDEVLTAFAPRRDDAGAAEIGVFCNRRRRWTLSAATGGLIG
jgi:hypothetical protein